MPDFNSSTKVVLLLFYMIHRVWISFYKSRRTITSKKNGCECEFFCYYRHGGHFEIHSDHKPLIEFLKTLECQLICKECRLFVEIHISGRHMKVQVL